MRLPLLQPRDAAVEADQPRQSSDEARWTGSPLFGSWLATRWEYRSVSAPERSRDVVALQGGSVTLSLGHGAWVLTCSLPRRGDGSTGGSFAVNSDTLALRVRGTEADEQLRWRLGENTLTLRSEATLCDFDDTGTEEPATFVAVLVPL